MKLLRNLTACLTAAVALLAAGLALSIYFGWNGEGQMYTAELISSKLRILLIPLLAWLVLIIVTAVFELRQPKKTDFSSKPIYPVLPNYARYAAMGVAALCGAWLLVYLCNRNNFASRDLEATFAAMLVHILPAAILLLVCAYFLQREVSPKPNQPKTGRVRAARIVLAILAVGLITVGVLNGGMRDVLGKAINICTECIGLG